MTGPKRLVQNGQDADLAAASGAVGRVTDWLARQLLAERERWVLWLPVAYGLGTAVISVYPRAEHNHRPGGGGRSHGGGL